MLYCNAGLGWQTDPSHGCGIKAETPILKFHDGDLELNSVFRQVLVPSFYYCHHIMSKMKIRMMGAGSEIVVYGENFPDCNEHKRSYVLALSKRSRNILVPACVHSSGQEHI